MATRGLGNNQIAEMSSEARRHLMDRFRHGAIGFAADLNRQARLLQAVVELRNVVVRLAGGKPGKTPGAFDLCPEEKRYFAGEQAQEQKTDTISQLNKLLEASNAAGKN